MSKILYVDSDGTKGTLPAGVLGYDAYSAGGDEGRVYVGTGTENIALAKLIGTSLDLPSGTSAERPVLTATEKAIRYNTELDQVESWNGVEWGVIAGGGIGLAIVGVDTEVNIKAIAAPAEGDIWISSDDSHGWLYKDADWVDIGSIVGPAGLTGNGISDISRTTGDGSVGTTDTYTITYTDTTTTTFDVVNGTVGISISSIDKTSTVDLIDTYTVTYSNASTSTFDIANGRGVDHISLTAGDGSLNSTDTHTVWGDSGETVNLGTFDVSNGKTVDHFTRTTGTGLAGETDTYTVYTDIAELDAIGTFDIYNGNDGGGTINDLTITDSTLWSSEKINNELELAKQDTGINPVVAAIIFG